jgi:tetratricopeptide (TPR) repeat protein
MGRSQHLYTLSLALLAWGCFLPLRTPAQVPQPGEYTLPGLPEPAPALPSTPPPPPPSTPSPPPTPTPSPASTPTSKPAEKKPANTFPTNPLDDKTPDPLLPKDIEKRSLTPEERKRLIPALDALNTQADTQLKAGDRVAAFDTWNRELRLRRYLGPQEEVKALGRVGDIAWRENEIPEARWITERLDKILAQANAPLTPGLGNNVNLGRTNVIDRTTLLDALGIAYQQVRLPQAATGVYQQLLTEAQQRRDEKKVDATLNNLAQLYVNWFNYPKAVEAYTQLLGRSQARKDVPNQVVYLTQLAYIYEQSKQPDRAIPYQQQLVNLYQKLGDPKPIPALRIRIADNYQLSSRPDLAERNYQTAYELARPLMQLGYAGDALKKLGAMYLSNNRLEAALRVYNFLVGVEQQAYNTYGVMSAYDQIGQIYRTQKNYPQAISAFQKGLSLARQLKYREDYFTAQIQQIAKQ